MFEIHLLFDILVGSTSAEVVPQGVNLKLPATTERGNSVRTGIFAPIQEAKKVCQFVPKYLGASSS
jgi:hypothetical protein